MKSARERSDWAWVLGSAFPGPETAVILPVELAFVLRVVQTRSPSLFIPCLPVGFAVSASSMSPSPWIFRVIHVP